MCQGGFSQAGRAVKQYMVEGFAPAFGSFYRDTEIFPDPGLTDKIVEIPGS
jgi:hypothetical protein